MKNTLEFSWKKPKEEFIKEILISINNSRGFTNYSEKELKTYFQENRILTLYNNKVPCGVIGYKKINKNWIEITPLMVLKKFRKQGYGAKLLQEIIKIMQHKNLYIMGINPIVKKIILRNNFHKSHFLQLPIKVINYLITKRMRWNKIKNFFYKKEIKFKEIEHYIDKKIP